MIIHVTVLRMGNTVKPTVNKCYEKFQNVVNVFVFLLSTGTAPVVISQQLETEHCRLGGAFFGNNVVNTVLSSMVAEVT